MIPRIIHYCWFGKGAMDPTVLICIDSWKKNCPEFEIRLWTEETFDVQSHPFVSKMYKAKKWAFVADYARLQILYKYGGVYVDTDMYLLKDISPLLFQNRHSGIIMAKESDEYINTAFVASAPNNFFIKKLIDLYDALELKEAPATIPVITTNAYNNLPELQKKQVTILDQKYFYPFNQQNIHTFDKKNPPKKSYGVHLYNFSWGTWYQKMLHKTSFYRGIVGVITFLGIKRFLKKILKLS